MNIEKYSCYKFEIVAHNDDDYPDAKYYSYKIYGEGCYPYYDGIIESTDMFDTEQEARFAAIGHIDLLENGEG